jgi:TPR repeat protein
MEPKCILPRRPEKATLEPSRRSTLPQSRGFMTEVQENLNDLTSRAECGDPGAQYSLGVLFLLGEILEQDLEAAYQWLARAACRQHPQAQSLVGKLAPNQFVALSRVQSKEPSRGRSIYDEVVRRLCRLAWSPKQPDGPPQSGALSWARVRFKIRF